MPHKKDCNNRDELGIDPTTNKDFCMNCGGIIGDRDDNFLKQAKMTHDIFETPLMKSTEKTNDGNRVKVNKPLIFRCRSVLLNKLAMKYPNEPLLVDYLPLTKEEISKLTLEEIELRKEDENNKNFFS